MDQEIRGSRQDNSPADVWQHGQSRRAKKEDTYQRIVEVAERLYRQFGFEKTTVANIAALGRFVEDWRSRLDRAAFGLCRRGTRRLSGHRGKRRD